MYRAQAPWFAAERNRLLRKAEISRRRCVLDLGTGTGELLRSLDARAGGMAVGVDKDVSALRLAAAGHRVACDACALPFPDQTFDLVFTQMFFLWARPLDTVLNEIRRVLTDDGLLIAAAEPDYGGVIEYPDQSGTLRNFVAELRSEGAEIHIGRALACALIAAGFQVECGTHPTNPLNGDSGAFAYVPYFHFLACVPRMT